MSNDRDSELTRAFAHVREPLPGDVFTTTLLANIARARRTRAWRRALGIAALVIAASLQARPILEKTAAVVRWAADVFPGAADLLITPWGWALSMLVGAWVLLRTRPARR
jgi:hypothetical protein